MNASLGDGVLIRGVWGGGGGGLGGGGGGGWSWGGVEAKSRGDSCCSEPVTSAFVLAALGQFLASACQVVDL